MRNEPARVGAIAVKSAAQVIVDSAGGHAVQGDRGHLRQFVAARAPPAPQQQADRHGVRKLRRGAEPAVLCIERPAQRRLGAYQESLTQLGRLSAAGGVVVFTQQPGQLMGLFGQGAAAALPCLRDGHEHLVEAGHPAARTGRPVGAAKERLQAGRQEHR